MISSITTGISIFSIQVFIRMKAGFAAIVLGLLLIGLFFYYEYFSFSDEIV